MSDDINDDIGECGKEILCLNYAPHVLLGSTASVMAFLLNQCMAPDQRRTALSGLLSAITDMVELETLQ